MKIYISVDIEGVAGINHWDETEATKPNDYEPFRKQMTQEVIAAIKGARKAGATEITVRDAHDTARNILPQDLPQGVQMIRGWSGHPSMMMEGLDESYDAVFLIGYHSPGASDGNPLRHTMTVEKLVETKLNGMRASECMLNTLYAASLHVPVVMVSGDEGLTKEAKNLNKDVHTVSTTRGVGNATYTRHPLDVLADIEKTAEQALKKKIAPVKFEETYLLELRYANHSHAYKASFYPGATLVYETGVQLRVDNIFDIHRAIGFML